MALVLDDVRSQDAGSTGRRNTGVKSLCWGFKLQGWRTMLVKTPMSYSAFEQGAINPAATVPILSSAQQMASGEQDAR
jgi:hypothetical protein